MGQGIDYSKVIADLEKKVAELLRTIAVLKREAGIAVEGGIVPGPSSIHPTAGAEQIPEPVVPGMFRGLSVSDAARKFLRMTKAKQKTSAICEALRAGGIDSNAKTFYGAVYTALSRNKDFKKLGKFWALAESPAPPATGAVAKPPRRAKRRKGGKKPKTSAEKATSLRLAAESDQAR